MIIWIAYLMGIGGCWVFADGVSSLWTYLPDKRQTWLRDHLLRVLRCLVGIGFVVMGAMLICQS